ncbi:outer membrane receptor protein [Galbibacter orientalis DSM 19592]|uniref:Outer membrane receptor protein n=1 Tax=Galbibacter orientalis DSM 19592 TaxID=926559 RepID=I3C7H6_9FLAO|nr:outer membrane beta-barrel family protein [Galbibacter orientalis]EIJ39569.1 outer membrane receptor protein [Galbibacter orientalis DSM 19592]
MKQFILCCMIALSTILNAQNSAPNTNFAKLGSVSGTVIDKSLQQPIPYATVVIKKEGNTIVGGITNDDGTFELSNIEEGSYLFEVQFIGYNTFSKAITISKENRKVALGTITLEENITELEGVDVVAERSSIEQKIDRKVINVGKDLTTQGATASDIMNNIPSLNVDQQTGDLSMRGNSNVRVMVDGKLSNVPVAQLLKQIPSTSIKKIELITNPSAKYNPEGMSGLINIVLYKDANIGFNGNLNLGLSYQEEAKFNSSIDLNYRRGKFNFYGNYGNNIGKYVNDGRIERFDDEASANFNENQIQNFNFFNNNKSHLYKLGVDFFLDDNNTISVFTNQNIYDGKGSGDTRITNIDPSVGDTQQLFISNNSNQNEQYNFDYKRDFEKEGHNIELEVDYSNFSDEENADFNYSGATTQPDYLDFVDTRRQQTIANLDYVNPLSEKSKLELGVETRNFETNVDYNSTGFTFNSGGQLVPTPSTEFIYGMDIYSGYATFGQNFEKWSYQVGARYENVSVKADTNSVRSFTDNYSQLYPSAFVTYSPSEKNQFQVSYSKRVDRPGLTQVNPIREWSTPIISSYGNESLKPQFTNSFETNYTRRLEHGSITLGVYYRAIKDEINRALYIDRLDVSKQVLTYDNFDDTEAFGFEISTNYKPLEWWSINGSFDLYSQTQRGLTEQLNPSDTPSVDDIVEEKIKVENVAYNARLNNNFTITKKLSLSLFGFYRGENKGIQMNAQPMYFVNTGARYSFAQGKGTFSLNFNDIFNTMQFRFEGERPYMQEGAFNWESRTIFAGLSYRFGGGKNRKVARKNRDNNTKESSGGGF